MSVQGYNQVRDCDAVSGGRPDMAQAGGSKPENLDAAMKKVFELVGQV
jgi:alanyl-tRNA synthetase